MANIEELLAGLEAGLRRVVSALPPEEGSAPPAANTSSEVTIKEEDRVFPDTGGVEDCHGPYLPLHENTEVKRPRPTSRTGEIKVWNLHGDEHIQLIREGLLEAEEHNWTLTTDYLKLLRLAYAWQLSGCSAVEDLTHSVQDLLERVEPILDQLPRSYGPEGTLKKIYNSANLVRSVFLERLDKFRVLILSLDKTTEDTGCLGVLATKDLEDQFLGTSVVTKSVSEAVRQHQKQILDARTRARYKEEASAHVNKGKRAGNGKGGQGKGGKGKGGRGGGGQGGNPSGGGGTSSVPPSGAS